MNRIVRDAVISLYDKTGRMAQPWLDAGYECWIVDLQHPVAYETGGITSSGRLHRVHADLTQPWLPPVDRRRVAFMSAFPPCDHLAVSGARWFQGKGLRRLASSIEMFATAAELGEWLEAPYLIENPNSTISTYWRKPDYTMSPEYFTGWAREDNYTKFTCLWIGNGFVMPKPRRVNGLPPPGRSHSQMPARPRASQHPQRDGTWLFAGGFRRQRATA